MKPTNTNANYFLRVAINDLAEALPARLSNRSTAIANAMLSIEEALRIQPEVAARVAKLKLAVEESRHTADDLNLEPLA